MSASRGAGVLITGGAGFIGSHLARRLARSGRAVTVLDDFSNPSPLFDDSLRRRVRLVEADVRDAAALRRAMRGAETVFHLAAVVSVPQAEKNPEEAYAVNAEGTRLVAAEALRAGCRRVVYASSCAVYGDTGRCAAREDALPRPLSHYALSKFLGERQLLAAAGKGLETVRMRFFNVYGPGQRWDSPYAAVIPRFVRQVLRTKPCVIYGDGRQTRDFVHAGDVVSALLLAARRAAAAGGLFNAATGRSVTLLQLRRELARASGKTQPPPRFAAPRPGEIRFSRASAEAAARVLGFRPRVALREGLRGCLAWAARKKV